MTVEILTFGCRLNAYESEVIRDHAAGLSDTVIINTCAVTAEAERQARQAIRRAVRERPGARIVVTGCAAQIDPQTWRDLPGVDRVLGNENKLRPESWAPDAPDAVSDIMAARETAAHLVTEFAGRARAFVQVQQGCDHRCSFCIIPFGRGPSRSVPVGVVVAQVRALVQAGYQEVVLTGVDIASYGPDLPGAPTLGQLVRRLLALVPELKRLRLSSIDPATIDDALWRMIGEQERLMPHLHLSLQSASDLILKRMKRRHLRVDARSGHRAGAGAAARHRDRRGPDRGFPDRERGAVRGNPGFRDRRRPAVPARVSLQRTPRHAGGTHAGRAAHASTRAGGTAPGRGEARGAPVPRHADRPDDFAADGDRLGRALRTFRPG